MTDVENRPKTIPFVQKEAYYLDDQLNIVRVLFNFFEEDESVRVKMKGYRFGALKDEDVIIEDIVLDRTWLMSELDAAVQKQVDKLSSLDVKVASLDVLIRIAVPEIPGLHRFLDLYGGDVTIDSRRHTLTRTRLKATIEGIEVSAHSIASKKDSHTLQGAIDDCTFSLHGAKSEKSTVKCIQQSTVRELDEFDFFNFHATVPYFNVTAGFLDEAPERVEAAKSLLRIPHDMQYRDFVSPSFEHLMTLINQTRESSVARILSSRKRDLDIEI